MISRLKKWPDPADLSVFIQKKREIFFKNPKLAFLCLWIITLIKKKQSNEIYLKMRPWQIDFLTQKPSYPWVSSKSYEPFSGNWFYRNIYTRIAHSINKTSKNKFWISYYGNRTKSWKEFSIHPPIWVQFLSILLLFYLILF